VIDIDTLEDMLCEIGSMMEIAETDYDLLDALDNVNGIIRSMISDGS
jgi:hypothetical protein